MICDDSDVVDAHHIPEEVAVNVEIESEFAYEHPRVVDPNEIPDEVAMSVAETESVTSEQEVHV